MLRGSAGRRQAKRSRPNPHRGPAQPPACPAQREEHRRELEALRAQLEGEQLRSQEPQRRWAVERRELQGKAERERQLLADRLHCAWEKQQAQEEQRLKEREQRQRVMEIRQLLRWKEAELHATQELLQQECDVALHQARELQQQLAKELKSPHRSSRAARAKLQSILSKLRRKRDGEQPACIRQLQHQLELERRLFNQYIVGSWESEPQHVESHRMSCSQDREGALGHHRAEQGSSRPAVKDAHVQVPEMSKEDLGLPGSTSSKLLEQHSCLQRALSDLERQSQALQAQNHLLREGHSPEVRRELQRLQQAVAKLEVVSKRLEEKCRQLQEIGKKAVMHKNPKQECSNPQEGLEESEGRLMAVCSLHTRRRTSPLIRRFLARHSYNPFEGPNEDPENELPLTAGQYVHIFGDVDEDSWFLGELMDGTRGLVPSNLVEEVSDDDLDTTVPPELRDLLLDIDDEEGLGSRSGGRVMVTIQKSVSAC